MYMYVQNLLQVFHQHYNHKIYKLHGIENSLDITFNKMLKIQIIFFSVWNDYPQWGSLLTYKD